MFHLILFCLYVFNLSASDSDSDSMVTVIAYRKPHDRDITQVDNSGAAGGGAMAEHNPGYVGDRIEQKVDFDDFAQLSLLEKTVSFRSGFVTKYDNYCLMPKGSVDTTNSISSMIIVKIDTRYPKNMHQVCLEQEIEKSGSNLEIFNYDFILNNHLQKRKNSWNPALITEPIGQQISAQRVAKQEIVRRHPAEQERMDEIRQLLQVREMQEQAEARAAIEMQEFDARRDHKIEENLARIELRDAKQHDLERIMEQIKSKQNFARNKKSDNCVELKAAVQNNLIQIRSELRGFPGSVEQDAMIEEINKLLGLILPGNDKKSLKNIPAIAAQANLIEDEFQKIKLLLSAERQHQDQQQSVVPGAEAGGGAASVSTQVTTAIVAEVAHSHVEAHRPSGRKNNSYSTTNPKGLGLSTSSNQAADWNHPQTVNLEDFWPYSDSAQADPLQPYNDIDSAALGFLPQSPYGELNESDVPLPLYESHYLRDEQKNSQNYREYRQPKLRKRYR